MDKKGIIIVIEDDLDDQFVFEEAFLELDFPTKGFISPTALPHWTICARTIAPFS